MTYRSIIELLAEADANLPDNTTGQITPVLLRTLIKDFVESMSPAYGAINLASQVLTLNPTTPTLIAPFSTDVGATPGFFTDNLVNGTITRTLNGVAGSTVFLLASGSVQGANNNDVIITLYKNGAPSPYRQTVNVFGNNNPAGFNIAAITYDAIDTTYDLRALAPAGTYTFTNILLIGQMQPVRSFV